MCLAALFFRVVEDAAVIVGANREEIHARPGEPPRVLDGAIRILAGRDPRADGTWLGINEHGVLVAVTNRRKSIEPTPARSRGLLAREALGFSTSAAAVEFATRELEKNVYAGCNLLIADEHRAVVLHAGDWLRVRPLPPGVHVLANSDVNDESDPRVAYVLSRLYQRPCSVAADCLDELMKVCSNPGINAPAICRRGPEKGTVSSTLVALRRPLDRSTLLHAQGPPDETPYADLSGSFAELTTSRFS